MNAFKNVRTIPNQYQKNWHELEFYGFIHFSINTFSDKEWGYGDESPKLFNPSSLDTRQWADIACRTGMKGLILTCKHHDGFCLWPSKYTEHSVKKSPWKNGKGDVVRELSDACRKFGLKFGVYLSPWDRNHADYGKPAYIEYYRNQLRELLTHYGTIFEVWLDGANGGDGYYGGANESRRIDNSIYYDWPNTITLIRKLQPSAVIFSDAGPDVRWIGNEKGLASETTWYTLNTSGRYPGYSFPGYEVAKDLGQGHRFGKNWVPPEADTSIRPGWFYHEHENASVKTPTELMELYYNSVGRGVNLLLNIPPDNHGLINEKDIEHLLAFRQIRDTIFKNNLAQNINLKYFENYVILEFPGPTEIDHIILSENISQGQYISSWQLEGLLGGQWQFLECGTTIGHKRIIRLKSTVLKCIRVMANCAKTIQNISVFDSQVYITAPKIERDKTGFITIDSGKAITRYTMDNSIPNEKSSVYYRPFSFHRSGIIKASILMVDNPRLSMLQSALHATKNFGIIKKNWQILSCSNQEKSHPATNAIDENKKTFCILNILTDQTAELCIDFGKIETIEIVGYLPRQDGKFDGIVTRYALYLSDNILHWETPIMTGYFDNITNNPVEQLIRLPKVIRGRFLKFVALSTKGSKIASIASIEVYTLTDSC